MITMEVSDMSAAMRSMQLWAIYALAVGLGLLLVPNLTIGVFGVEPTDEVWIRVVGVVVLALDIMYWSIVIRNDEKSLKATVYERWFAALALAILAATSGPWQLLLFAALDFAGATWTYATLRPTSAIAPSQ
jgi:hypothetical protein